MEASENRLRSLERMADRLRRHSIVATAAAKSGHPTSCMSCAELVSVLFFQFLRFDIEHPKSLANDRFILSKGHAAPILWAALAEAGAFPIEKLETLRQFDSELEGHPTPRAPWVDVATGSLGQGLSAGLGMALASPLNNVDNRVYVLLGDGETAEGAVWEAAALAGHYRIANLTAIVDINGLGQSQATMAGKNVQNYVSRFSAFGWKTIAIDGHDVRQVIGAYQEAIAWKEGPTVILAQTVKGKGVRALEDAENHHGKPVAPDLLEEALREIGTPELDEPLRLATPSAPAREPMPADREPGSLALPPPEYKVGDEIATRKACGQALARLGEHLAGAVALDGDVKNSTYSETFAEAFPNRFFECYIAEQNMVGMASGFSAVGKVPFVSTFACFLTRAFDQIRMAAISRANIKFCGSHAGVSIGEDGPSQMGLEDIAMFRTIPDAAVLVPADAVAAERCVVLAAARPGIVYLRTARPATPVIYERDQTFRIGGSQILKESTDDRATIVAAGITVHEALRAAERLARDGIPVRVLDCYSIKPIDKSVLIRAAEETGIIITVEDHYPEGGLGEAVLAAIANYPVRAFTRLAVTGLPRSGSSAELLDHFGISANRIVEAVREAIGSRDQRKSA